MFDKKWDKILNKKFLIEEYSKKKTSIKVLSKRVKCGHRIIRKYLDYYKIPVHHFKNLKQKLTKNFLELEYCQKQKHVKEIAKDCNCSISSVNKFLKLYKIDFRSKNKPNRKITYNYLYDRCVKNKNTILQIAKECNCDTSVIISYLCKYNLPIDLLATTLTKDILIDRYIVKSMSSYEIGKEFGCSFRTVLRYLKKYQISIRPSYHFLNKTRICNDKFFNTQSHDSMYLLGIIITDGCIHLPNNSTKNKQMVLKFCHAYKDKEIVEFARECLAPQHDLYLYCNGKQIGLNVTSDKLCNTLINKYGITPRKTGNERLDFKIKDKYLPDFLRGLLDGDGTVQCNGNYIYMELLSSSEIFIKQIHKKLGYGNINICYNSKNNKLTKDGNNYKDLYHLSFTQKNAIRFRDFIYSTNGFSLKRKKEIVYRYNSEKRKNSFKKYTDEEKDFIVSQYILMLSFGYNHLFISEYIGQKLCRTCCAIVSSIRQFKKQLYY